MGIDLSPERMTLRSVSQQMQAPDVLTLQRTVDLIVPSSLPNEPGSFGALRGLVSYNREVAADPMALY